MNLTYPQIFLTGIIILGLLWVLLIGRFWIKAMLSGIRISPLSILFMRLRGSPVKLLINELIKAVKSGVVIDVKHLETCSLSGGNPRNIVDGLVYAKRKGKDLTIKEALNLDKENHDITKYLRNK